MSESRLKASIQRWIRENGGFAMKISDRFTKGIPDIWICIKGRGMWLELKTDKGRVDPLQTWHIEQINSVGGEAYVVRSLDELIEIYSRPRDRRA